MIAQKHGRGDDHGAIGMALARVPGLAAGAPRAITRLPGWNNATYRVTLAAGDVIVRLPGPSDLVDRRAEARNLAAAAALGVGPAVLAMDQADGILVYQAVAGEPFVARGDAIERAARALRRLHGSNVVFQGELDAEAVLRRYLGDLGGHDLGPSALAVAEVLAAAPAPPAPCHNDLVPGNMIDDGRTVTFIDWEFSAMNDPLWDVAYLAAEGGFDDNGRRRLVATYGVADGRLARLRLLEALCLAVNGFWALLEGSGRPELLRYATDHLRRFAIAAETLAPDLTLVRKAARA